MKILCSSQCPMRRRLQFVFEGPLTSLASEPGRLIAERSILDFAAESAFERWFAVVVQTFAFVVVEVVTVATDPQRCRLAVAEAEVPPSAWNCLVVLPMGRPAARDRWQVGRLGRPYWVPRRSGMKTRCGYLV